MSVFSICVMTHMHELLGALLTVFTHILLWVLISCLILIKALILDCSCVDSYGP